MIVIHPGFPGWMTVKTTMADLSLKEISERLTDAILDEPHINRASLEKIILPVLKIWLKKTDQYKKTGIPRIDKLQMTIQSKELQQRFWKNMFRETIGEEHMQLYYDQLHEILSSEGLIQK